MENFIFYAPTEYVFGKDVENRAGELSERYLGKKILVIYGGGSALKSGLIDRVGNSLVCAGIDFQLFGGVKPNPTDLKVREGIDICKKESITGLLAVGGGSVIDTAKAIAAGSLYDGDFWDFYDGTATVETALPVGVVLTIPAAGSEGSGNSVITLEKDKRKLSLRTPGVLRPKFALMNPELTYTLPPYQTACGITDMLAHILERYFTPTEGVEVTDRVSEGLMKAIIEDGRKVVTDPYNYDIRANIMWAGTLAHNGLCGTGKIEDWSSHAMEHEISALHDVAHGAGLAVVMPAYMTYMAEHKPLRIALFARNVFGVDQSDDREAALAGVKYLKEFFKYIGMPVSFAELGIENPDINEFVRRLHENKGPRLGNYFPLDKTDTKKIYMIAAHA